MRIRVAIGLALIGGIACGLFGPGRVPAFVWALGGLAAGFAIGGLRPGPAVPVLSGLLLAVAGQLSRRPAVSLDRAVLAVVLIAIPCALAVWGLHSWLWAGTRSDARDGSLVASAESGRVRFRIALAVTLLGFAAFFRDARILGGLLLGLGGLTLFCMWGADALRLRELSRWLRSSRLLDGEPPVRANHVDVGVGDEQWLVSERPDHPYRAGSTGSLLLFGSLREGVHRLAMMTASRTPLLVGVALLFGLLPSGRGRYDAPYATLPKPSPKAAAVAKPTGPAPSRHGWYPQPAPILADLTGDGVEDIIGLRWDWDHEESALSVTATNGRTFATIWSTPSHPAKWYSKAIRLVRADDRLFLTDSEGNLFTHELATGKQVAWATVDAFNDLCAAPDAPARIWAEPETHHYDDAMGTLITQAGERSTVKRPEWCKHTWERRLCPNGAGDPCYPKKTPASIDKRISVKTLLEQGDAGIVLGWKHKEAHRSDAVPSVFLGYDPAAQKERFETKLAFTEDEIHGEPDLETELSGGRLFAYYQLKNGQWLLGARDTTTGDLLWHKNPPRTEHGTNFGSMKASSTRLYVRLNTRLEVFDAKTGESVGVVW
jgi:hypothetical protein